MNLSLNKKGFSLLELTFASALTAGLFMLTVNFFRNKSNEIKKAQNTLEETLDGLNFNDQLRRDLFDIKYSYNSLLMKDDNNNYFFDFMPEGVCSSNCSRILTLTKPTKLNTYSKGMYFIIKDSTAAVEQVYFPSDAYQISAGVSSTDNNLKFISLNYKNVMTLKKDTPWAISKNLPSRLILIYAPTMTYSSPSDLGNKTGKMIQYMGWLNSSNLNGLLTSETISTSTGALYNNLDYRFNDKITSEDKFFKRIPYMSGTAVFVMVAPVKVIRYRIKTVQENGSNVGKLVRETLGPQNVYSEKVIASDVENIVFSRESIVTGMIESNVTYKSK